MRLDGLHQITYRCDCEVTVGNLITKLLSEHSRNPQRVSEAVHESSARNNVLVPGHPDSLPGGGRITPIIYVGGGQAELNSFPLVKIVPSEQGIVLFKESTNLGFSCN